MTESKRIDTETLLAGARANPGCVVVPRADNEEALEAVAMAVRDGVVKCGLLLGDKKEIETVARKVSLPLQDMEIREVGSDEEIARIAAETVARGQGDFLLKGQIDTKIYLRAILNKELGLVPEGATLTHVAAIHLPTYHKLLISTDAAITIEPGIEEKMHLIKNAIAVAEGLGIRKPKVAMMAAVEKVNPKMASTVHAQEMVRRHREEGAFPNAIIEGPYDIYIATSKEAAEVKKVSGQVCGDADILVFHEINSANAFYKSMQRFVPGCWAAGLIGGARVPILLPSRADDAETKRVSILVAAYLGARARAR